MGKLTEKLALYKDTFFVVQLLDHPTKQVVPKEPDENMYSELMDSRDTFLGQSRENHWEFCDLRRAKWSTSIMLYR